MSLLSEVKLSLGISHSKMDDEINATIDAACFDLRGGGAGKAVEIKEENALVRQAIKMYCRSWFNYQGLGEKWHERYESLKCFMGLSGDYRGEAEAHDNE